MAEKSVSFLDEKRRDDPNDAKLRVQPEMNAPSSSSFNLDDQEVASISSTASTGSSSTQHTLKDNYVKARREREIEEEQAELEKKRLQEILDLCIEFQERQESIKTNNLIKTASNNLAIQSSSTSSSISSTSTSTASSSSSSESIKQKQIQNVEEQLISTLPKLTTVLNLNSNSNQKTISQRSSAPLKPSTSDAPTSSNFEVNFYL